MKKLYEILIPLFLMHGCTYGPPKKENYVNLLEPTISLTNKIGTVCVRDLNHDGRIDALQWTGGQYFLVDTTQFSNPEKDDRFFDESVCIHMGSKDFECIADFVRHQGELTYYLDSLAYESYVRRKKL